MSAEIEAWITEWIEDVTGGVVTRIQRSFGGATRVTWFVDVSLRSIVLQLVARVESGASAFSATPFTLRREAAVYRALEATSIPVPRLVDEHPSGRALLLERRPGSTDLRQLTTDQRTTILHRFVEHLAALHRLDPASLAVDGFELPTAPEEHATNDLDAWTAVGPPELSPEVAFAIGWLRTHAPSAVARTSLVQGDTGPGNFVVDNGRITGIFDWELAHFGDPHDDLAWLIYRITSPRGYPDVEVAPLLRRYERASGIRVDPGSLAYYTVFVHVRGALATEAIVARGHGTLGFAGYALEHARFLRSLTLALGTAMGVDAEPAEVAAAATPRTPLFERAIDDLVMGVVPLLETSAARLRARESAILVDHLARLDRFGAAIADAERADPMSPAAAREAGATGDASALAALMRRSALHRQLWSDPLVR